MENYELLEDTKEIENINLISDKDIGVFLCKLTTRINKVGSACNYEAFRRDSYLDRGWPLNHTDIKKMDENIQRTQVVLDKLYDTFGALTLRLILTTK